MLKYYYIINPFSKMSKHLLALREISMCYYAHYTQGTELFVFVQYQYYSYISDPGSAITGHTG